MTDIVLYLLIAAAGGALLGVLITVIVYQRKLSRLEAQREALRASLHGQEELEKERTRALEGAIQAMQLAFDDLANKSLDSNSDTFLKLARENLGQFQTQASADFTARAKAIDDMMRPIAETLDATRKQLEQTERQRQQAFGAIDNQLKAVRSSHETLQLETSRLVGALQRPDVGGQWGEITLRRIVELSGMVEHCDFVEQPSTSTDNKTLRPDLVVKLPDRGEIVVDAKTPLDAYLAATQANDDASRRESLRKHALNMRRRVRELAGKNYWAQFDNSPDFVLMFIPGDQFLAAALSADPSLLEDALKLKVMPVTPTSFIALLKAIAYGWRQSALTDNAKQVRDLAVELYKRLAVFTEHLATVGGSLNRSVDAYNKAIGSLERSVLPGARRFTEMGISEKKPLANLEPVDTTARRPSSSEDRKLENVPHAAPDDGR